MHSVGKNIGKRQRNTVKSDRTTKLWYPRFCIFLTVIVKVQFL